MLRNERMKKLLGLIFIFGIISSFGQGTNQLDAKGRKQGPFVKYYESAKDKLFYKGQFKDDTPYGTFTYFYKNGEVKSYMHYANDGIVRSEVFLDNGSLMAKGKYINKIKDSTWVYYNSNGSVKSMENWKNGLKFGLEVVFFNNGDTSEVMTWSNDKLNGPWRQYFGDGKLKMRTNMIDDEYEGETEFYHQNGKLSIKGKYVNGFRNGSWYHYNENGSLQMQVLYRGGEKVKEKRENGTFVSYYESEIPESEINYKNGMKHGPFKIYHEGAEKVRVEEMDKLTGEIIPKEIVKGIQVKTQGEYRFDKLHGTITHFNKAGKVIKTENFENGMLVNK